jgi:hypothetical protein
MPLLGLLCLGGISRAFAADPIDLPRLPERVGPLTDFPVQRTIRLVEHGVKPDDNQDDLPALRAVLKKIEGQQIPTLLLFEPGHYLFSSMKRREHAINLIGVENLILDGQGASITMTNPESGVFNIRHSQRVIIRNFSVDYDPLPYTQGTLVAVDVQAQWFDVCIDPGFPLPSETFFKTCMKSWGALKDPMVPGKLKDLSEAGAVHGSRWEDQGHRVFRFQAPDAKDFQQMEVGDKYIHLARTGIAQHFHADECTDLTAMNLTVYASPASSFAANSCERFSVIGCKVLIKPGRWHSSNGDAIHCQRNRTGPWIEGCYIEGIIDDPLNIYSMRSQILKRVDDHTLLVKALRPPTFVTELAVGQPLTLLSQRDGVITGESRITAVKESEQGIEVTVDHALPEVYLHDRWDSDVAFAGYNLSRDFVLKNNTFRVSQRHCIIMGGRGLIQGNTFDQISGPGLSVLNHNRARNEAESLLTGDLIIRGNHFINCDFGPFAYHPKQAYGCLYLGSKTWDQKPGKARLIQRVLIEDNTFDNFRKAGINLNNVEHVLIRNNRFTSLPSTPLDHDTSHAAIMLDRADHVQIVDNQLDDPRDITFIKTTPMVTGLHAENNKINKAP